VDHIDQIKQPLAGAQELELSGFLRDDEPDIDLPGRGCFWANVD
jgi:hypothetical protein